MSASTDDPFLVAIAAFACLFDARLGAVTPPPLPPMVLHAAAQNQGFEPDLPPARWLPSVARALRQHRPWGVDELLKSLQFHAGDNTPFRRLRKLMPLLADWRVVDSIAAWLAVEPGQLTQTSAWWVTDRPSAPLQCLANLCTWHRQLELPLSVRDRDAVAGTLIQLLRTHKLPGQSLELISKALKEMLKEPSPPRPDPVDGDTNVSVRPLKEVAVTELRLLEVLAEVLDDRNTHNLGVILSEVFDVALQLWPSDVEALYGVVFNPARTTSVIWSMRLRLMGRLPTHRATTAENIRCALQGLGGLTDVKPTVRGVLSLVDWSIEHPETHHRATLFDPTDGAQRLRRFFDGTVTYADSDVAVDVILTMLRAHTAGLIDLGEHRQWPMLLADIASRFRLLTPPNCGGGPVVAALAAVPAVEAAVRQRYRG